MPADGGGGCLIATALDGSALQGALQPMRRFRDRWLRSNAAGRALVSWYDRASPPVAARLRQNPPLRVAVRWAIAPVALAVAHPVGALTVGGLLFALGVRRRRRRR